MKVRFISDPHFGHENMALRRGFSCADEMDEHIIKSFNSVVQSDKDITYILGDITMEKLSGIERLTSLRGVIHVGLGNHDKKGHSKEILSHVSTVFAYTKYKNAILTHVPVHPKELEYKSWEFCIHGHVHENTIEDNRYWNVCAEVIDYKPKTYEELKEIYLK